METVSGIQFIVMLILVMIPIVFIRGITVMIEMEMIFTAGDDNSNAWDQYHYIEMIPHTVASMITEILLSGTGGFALTEFYCDYLYEMFPMHAGIVVFLIVTGIVLGVYREWLSHRTPEAYRELLGQQFQIHNCCSEDTEEEDESDE